MAKVNYVVQSGIKMDALTVIEDNFEAKNNSFLYYLREKSLFSKEALRQLCESVHTVAEQEVNIAAVALKLHTIHIQTLEAFLYHFNPDDPYKIINMPENYNKMLFQLEKCIDFYFKTRLQ